MLTAPASRSRRAFVTIAAAIATLCLSADAFGLAALKNGAKTSTKPTSTDPVIYNAQLASDPTAVERFQLSQLFDPSQMREPVTFENVRALNGYVLEQVAVDNQRGIVSVRGHWGNPDRPIPTDEINIFVVDYPLSRTAVDPNLTLMTFRTTGVNNVPTFPNPFGTSDFIRSLTPSPQGGSPLVTIYSNDPALQFNENPDITGLGIFQTAATFKFNDPHVSLLGTSAGIGIPPSPPAGGTIAFSVPGNPVDGYGVVVRPVPAGPSRAFNTVYFDFVTQLPDPRTVLVAMDFVFPTNFTPADIQAFYARELLVSVDPVFGAGYDAMLAVPAGNSAFFTFDYDFGNSGVQLTTYAVTGSMTYVIPEPAALGLLVPAAAMLSNRRRRA